MVRFFNGNSEMTKKLQNFGYCKVKVNKKYFDKSLELSLKYSNKNMNIIQEENTIKVAKILEVQPIITSATDNLGIIVPDILAKNNNLIIED